MTPAMERMSTGTRTGILAFCSGSVLVSVGVVSGVEEGSAGGGAGSLEGLLWLEELLELLLDSGGLEAGTDATGG